MKRFLSLLVILGLLFGVTACGGEEKASAKAKVEKISAKEQYLIDVRKTFPKSDGLSDEELIHFGKSLCSNLDKGYTFQGILLAGSTEGIPQRKMTKLLKTSVPTFCPQHTKAMELNLH